METKLSLNNLCCRILRLQAQVDDAGILDLDAINETNDSQDASILALQTDVELLQAPNTEVIHGAGTAYALTNAAAAIDLGTTDPAIVIGVAGTYLLLATLKVEYTGATVVAETATLKLRRTNNTAADVTATPVVIDLPVATTLTHTYGVVHLPPVLYTTTNTDDAISLFGQVSATLGAGTIDVSMADIVAIRIA